MRAALVLAALACLQPLARAASELDGEWQQVDSGCGPRFTDEHIDGLAKTARDRFFGKSMIIKDGTYDFYCAGLLAAKGSVREEFFTAFFEGRLEAECPLGTFTAPQDIPGVGATKKEYRFELSQGVLLLIAVGANGCSADRPFITYWMPPAQSS